MAIEYAMHVCARILCIFGGTFPPRHVAVADHQTIWAYASFPENYSEGRPNRGLWPYAPRQLFAVMIASPCFQPICPA